MAVALRHCYYATVRPRGNLPEHFTNPDVEVHYEHAFYLINGSARDIDLAEEVWLPSLEDSGRDSSVYFRFVPWLLIGLCVLFPP